MSPNKSNTRKTKDSPAKERPAMQEHTPERRAETKQVQGEHVVLAKIAEMPEPDRTMAERLHTLIKTRAPTLVPRLWYGMPAYTSEGKVICFFQSAQKFNTRYSTLGFTDAANLDAGAMWPVAFALKELTPAEETVIGALVEHAVRQKPPGPASSPDTE